MKCQYFGSVASSKSHDRVLLESFQVSCKSTGGRLSRYPESVSGAMACTNKSRIWDKLWTTSG